MSHPLGDPGSCRGHAFYDFLMVDLQISPVKLLPGVGHGQTFYDFVRVDLQISPVELLFGVGTEQTFYDFVRVDLQISPVKLLHGVGNGQTFYDFWQSPFTPYGGLGGSTSRGSAFWISCSFVTCKSHGVGEARLSKPIGSLMSKCPMCRHVQESRGW